MSDEKEKKIIKDEPVDKELNKEELDNVSGGYLWFGEDAPDGHESTCLIKWYDGMDDYYWTNRICKACGSDNVQGIIDENNNKKYMKCLSCGAYLKMDC